MGRFIYCVLLLAFSSAAFSQKVYFIYLQSEAEQPFFVKIEEKTYNSNPTGYLILSQLKDSSYNFKVGFPQNKWPDQQFLVDIKSKDRGYLLKNFGEKGWGLFDFQTMSIQMSAENNAKDKAARKEFRVVSTFTEILSKAANDPSLKEKPVFAIAKTEEKSTNILSATNKEGEDQLNKQPVNEQKTQIKTEEKEEAVQPVALKEEKTTLKEPDTVIKTPIKKEETPIAKGEDQKKEVSPAAVTKQETVTPKEETKVVPVETYKKSIVTKKAESSTTEGFGLTFIDQHSNGKKDTIKIVIPNSKELFAGKNDQQQDEKKFLDITEQTKETNLAGTKVGAKNNCSSISSESDFLKLRKKMAGQKTEEAMIEEAKKGFKAKCFTTEQIKNLGNLFLNEAGKFQFYEAAYPFSSDKDNFTVLQTELKDNYFIHRFKNLVKPGSL